jgi:xanthine dehydrogenase accessory factor
MDGREHRDGKEHCALVVILRGGGDLASGVALRLFHAGIRLLVTELPQPLVVRRLVSFAQAVYSGQAVVEGVTACLASNLAEALSMLEKGELPVLVDPFGESLGALPAALPAGTPTVLVDARMTKQPPETAPGLASFVIGLGPGYVAGENCHAVIETNRGHRLGRVIWRGAPEDDSGMPERVIDRDTERVLRAPADGELRAIAEIGDHLEAGQLIAEVGGQAVQAPFRGVLRGLIYPGLHVWKGLKIGDVDPRDDPRYCRLVSDKSLAVGGGVLEAILSRPELRAHLWD